MFSKSKIVILKVLIIIIILLNVHNNMYMYNKRFLPLVMTTVL